MTRFLEEVNEQPQALKALVSYYDGEGRPLLARWREFLAQAERLSFCGMGTSEHVGQLVREDLEAAGKAVCIQDAGEYLHYGLARTPATGLWVLISQSGESTETLQVTRALAGNVPLVVLTNNEQSGMAKLADLCLPLKAGAEVSVTNKTYLNSLALLYLLAGGGLDKLAEVAEFLAAPVNEPLLMDAAQLLQPAGCVQVIGRGPALAAARQLALTFMEGARSSAAAFTGGAFRHGPFELLGSNHRAVLLAATGRTSGLCLGMLREMLERGSRVVLLTDLAEVPGQANLRVIQVETFGDERLFPLAITVVQNYLLHHTARLRGYEAGVFSVVSKVTTME